MNTQPTLELTQWLRDNSSGVYRPAAEAADVIEQLQRERDEAREQGNDMREKWLAKNQCCEYLGAELHEAINQRDRLAEALKEYREALSDGPENCSYKMYEAVDEFAEKALQSLTPNAKP